MPMISQEELPEELRLLIVDRYTAVEVVERLELSIEDILDNFSEQVYNNLERFDELCADLGIEFKENETYIHETGYEEET